MAQMRSQDRGELTGKPEVPVSGGPTPQAPAAAPISAAKAPRARAASTVPAADVAPVDRDTADHVVVLWDEVKAPETVETKPLTKDLPDDPAAH